MTAHEEGRPSPAAGSATGIARGATGSGGTVRSQAAKVYPHRDRDAVDEPLVSPLIAAERGVLGALLRQGPHGFVALASTPFPTTGAWLSGPRHLAFQAYRDLAKRPGVSVPIRAEKVADAIRQNDPARADEILSELREAGYEEGGDNLDHLVGQLADLREAIEPITGDQLPAALKPASALLDQVYPPIAFAIEPYFPMGEVTEVNGAHGIFKSTAALAACLSVATGQPWGGARPMKGRAAFITMEDDTRTLARRVKAWLESIPDAKERTEAEADIRENLRFLAREQTQSLAMTASDRGGTVVRGHVVERVAELVRGCTLVVLETASRLHDGQEMNEALAVFARAVERVATVSHAAVVIVRHIAKAEARAGGQPDSYSGRGGGSFSDAARSIVGMWRDPVKGDEYDPLAAVYLAHTKSTHAPRGPMITWKPVACEHGVYLRHVPRTEQAQTDDQKMLAFLRDQPEGMPKSKLKKKEITELTGLTGTRAQAALKRLEDARAVVLVSDVRGATKQKAEVYRIVPCTLSHSLADEEADE